MTIYTIHLNTANTDVPKQGTDGIETSKALSQVFKDLSSGARTYPGIEPQAANGNLDIIGASGNLFFVGNGVTAAIPAIPVSVSPYDPLYDPANASDVNVAQRFVIAINDKAAQSGIAATRYNSSLARVDLLATVKGTASNGLTTVVAGTGVTAHQSVMAGGVAASQTRPSYTIADVAASGTITLSSSSGVLVSVINGISISTASLSGSDGENAIEVAAAINAETNALVAGIVTASAALKVITISATQKGKTGNSITTTGSGTGVTANQARLAGGTAGTTYSF